MSFKNFNRILDGTFSLESNDGPLVFEQPFEGDVTSLIARQRVWRDSTFYVKRLLNAAHPTWTTFYLVEETNPVHIGGGIFQYDRIWANIPASRTESETYPALLPGISQQSSGSPVNIASVSTFGTFRIGTVSPHGFIQHDPVSVLYAVFDATVGLNVNKQVERTVLAVPSSTTMDVAAITEPSTITWQSVWPRSAGRGPITRVVNSWVQFDYFLPGVSAGIAKVDDIAIFNKPLILGEDGNETDTYGTDTKPTAAQYRAQIAAKALVVAEPSSTRRWRGNIYERSTRFILAQ
jgi:hypothetical protein